MFFKDFNELLKVILNNIIMYIRNYNGEIVFFDRNKYAFEYDMYKELWRILYNIDLDEDKNNVMSDLIDFIKYG
tara:strand:+ start:96 stop:317 length:222 start_codon:yes stop_codon:yes gene_type:complete